MSADSPEAPEGEAAWFREQRANVLEYLAAGGIERADIPQEPTWAEPPYVAIWPVRSLKNPEAVGWWAISGDVPTDYVSSSEVRDERSAMRAFGRRWNRAARKMAKGEEPADVRIGNPSEWRELAPLLASRAQLLSSWAEDDEVWS